jgi:hypothetical protein
MNVNINSQQRQQIVQTKEFADKFNELTKEWKPATVLDGRLWLDDAIMAIPLTKHNMPYSSFVEYCSLPISDMEWGLQQKACQLLLSHRDTTLSEQEYYSRITPAYTLLHEIETHILSQQEKAIQHAFLILKETDNGRIINP